MLEEMLEAVAQKRSLGRIVLHLLIQPHLDAFNFACGVGDVYFALQFLGERCQVTNFTPFRFILFYPILLLVADRPPFSTD